MDGGRGSPSSKWALRLLEEIQNGAGGAGERWGGQAFFCKSSVKPGKCSPFLGSKLQEGKKYEEARVKIVPEGLQTRPAVHGLHFLPTPEGCHVPHPPGRPECTPAVCAKGEGGCWLAEQSLSQGCCQTRGLCVLTPSTGEGGKNGEQIPNSTCENDRNKGALLPGAEQTQLPGCGQSSLGSTVSLECPRAHSGNRPGSQRKTAMGRAPELWSSPLSPQVGGELLGYRD